MLVKKHMALMGLRVEDKVTGTKGVVSAISFDLYGCIQAAVKPRADENGKSEDARWFDVRRLIVTSNDPVMDVPNFDFGPVAEGKKGAAEKPPCSRW